MKPDRFIIDRAVDWRKQNLPHETRPIKTNLSAADLHKVLGLPGARDGKYPTSVTYRGFRIAAKDAK